MCMGRCSIFNVCVYVAKSLKIQSSNTVVQDTAFDSDRATWKDDWRVTDTQVSPPGESTQHGSVHCELRRDALHAMATAVCVCVCVCPPMGSQRESWGSY